MTARRPPICWGQKALRHAWEKHGVTLDELKAAAADPGHDFRRSRGRSFKLIGMGRDRLLTLILRVRIVGGSPCLEFVTAWPSVEREKRLYRRG